MKITYKIITPKELQKYKIHLLNLLDEYKKRPFEILKSLKNTDYIVLALDKDMLIASNQIISDKYFIALFINLYVKPEYRNLWIWWKIIEKSIAQSRKLKVKNIELVPDPSDKWLNNLYAKYWFKEWIYMWMK